jgi:hypothetical protein
MPAPVTSMARASGTSCAVGDGGVYCWGSNYYAVVPNSFSLTPALVATLDSGVTQVSAGWYHACAIQNGALRCWGYDNEGELGQGTIANAPTIPVDPVGMGSGVSDVSAGLWHTCAIQNGGAFCWGKGNVGQLGNGLTNDSSVPLAVQGLSSGVTAIAAGSASACAIQNGNVKCWGSNQVGTLGDGGSINYNGYSATPIQVVGLSNVTAIGVMGATACAALGPVGQLKCWGDDSNGGLGHGTPLASSSTPVESKMANCMFGVSTMPEIPCSQIALLCPCLVLRIGNNLRFGP